MSSPAADSTRSAPPTPADAQSAPARGRYGPFVHVSRFDLAAQELTWQLPVEGELFRLMPGADRPDYSLMVLQRPLHFYPPTGFDLERVETGQRVPDRKGRPMVRVHALLVCARFVGEQLHEGMRDLPVNLAFVLDNSLARDERVDFAKLEYAGVGYLTEGRAGAGAHGSAAGGGEAASGGEPGGGDAGGEPTGAASGGEGPDGEPAGTDVARKAADVLRRGVEERRGSPVSQLWATFTLGDQQEVTGLTGNADGQAPEPTEATFARLNEVFARLADDPTTARVRRVRIRVGDGLEELALERD